MAAFKGTVAHPLIAILLVIGGIAYLLNRFFKVFIGPREPSNALRAVTLPMAWQNDKS